MEQKLRSRENKGLFKVTQVNSTSLSTHRIEVKVAQSCPIPCDPVDYTVDGILQARILERVAVPFFRESSQLRDGAQVSHIADGFFTS